MEIIATLATVVTIIGGFISIITFIEKRREKKRKQKEELVDLSRNHVPLEDKFQASETGMMFALVKEHNGSGLTLTTKPIPTIRPNEVLVKVKVASICGSDLHIYHWRDLINKRIQVPRIIGHEFCGVVVKCGEEVSGIAVGEFVAAEKSYCLRKMYILSK